MSAETAAMETMEILDETHALRSKIETLIMRIFLEKELRKEKLDTITLMTEELEHLYARLGEEEIVAELPSGEFGLLKKSHSVKEKLDKEGLAQELQISKDELKTPFDFSKLTELGKLTPDMITRHSPTEVVSKLKLSKKKTKPKKKK